MNVAEFPKFGLPQLRNKKHSKNHELGCLDNCGNAVDPKVALRHSGKSAGRHFAELPNFRIAVIGCERMSLGGET